MYSSMCYVVHVKTIVVKYLFFFIIIVIMWVNPSCMQLSLKSKQLFVYHSDVYSSYILQRNIIVMYIALSERSQ